MKKWFVLSFALVAYVSFVAVFAAFFLGFVGGFFGPVHLDDASTGSWGAALLTDVLLVALFAVQHSVMARAGFKAWLTRFLPETMERSLYVLASNLILVAFIFFWAPLPGTLWQLSHPVLVGMLHGLLITGFLLALAASFLLDHFELFGLSQAWAEMSGRAPAPQAFRTPLLYRAVRHPLQLGVLIMLWATPRMTVTHFLLAVLFTGYIFLGLYLEELDLVKAFGARYRAYQQRVSMLLPLPRAGRRASVGLLDQDPA